MEKKKKSKYGKKYSAAFKEKVVKLYLEERYTTKALASEFGCSKDVIYAWIKEYRNQREVGVEEQPSGRGVAGGLPGVDVAVGGQRPLSMFAENGGAGLGVLEGKIVELKSEEPSRGIRRISDILKRFFFLKASPEKVRTVLHEAKLMSPPRKRRQRNDVKPRFFERATPNQMWQSDICTFRLAGQNAYLIGFMDDYSRYMVGLGLYRSQTAENVLEVLKTAVGEYGVSKEMLTDNGRQYTNWRGTTRFEQYLTQNRIKHIKSSPHHPMTLGKIERFWQTIQQEFLFRAQFDSFESARERLSFWVKYYNYKRPNQGIDGLCPADRYFEVQNELKTTLAKGVQDNVLELALRGKPKSPFYMVGRLGGQNVAIRAEKGKIHMHVDEAGAPEGKVLEYDMNAEENINGSDAAGNSASEAEASEERDPGTGEVQGGPCDLDGAAEGERAVPGLGCEPHPGGPLGGAGAGGDAAVLGAQDEEIGAGTEGAELAPGAPSGEALAEEAREAVEAGGTPWTDPGESEREGSSRELKNEVRNGEEEPHQERAAGERTLREETRGSHLRRPRRPLHRLRWRG